MKQTPKNMMLNKLFQALDDVAFYLTTFSSLAELYSSLIPLLDIW